MNIVASGEDSPLDGFEFRPHNCFACGELNAHGLHLELHLEPGRCWTDLALSERFEGWEGVIHGGILCTILDEVMAWSLVEQDNWGVTARMNVEFRRPVGVGQSIHAEGWITEDRRRIQRTGGRIVDATTGAELVRADAAYVAAPEDKKRELKQRYAYREERAQAVRAARSAGMKGVATEPASQVSARMTTGSSEPVASPAAAGRGDRP